MNPTLRTSRTAQRTTPRRGLLALAVLAAATLTWLAPTSHVDAGSQAQRHSCATANAATYTVAEGDSWFGIAVASGTSTSALLGANGADASDVLYPGDVLCLPPGAASPGPRGGCAATHVVERDDSWFAISRAAGVSMNGLLESNNATATTVIQPGAKVCLPAGAASTAAASTARSCVRERAVAAGESWYVISRSTGVPIDALVAANNAKRSSPIHPGQVLCLPEVGFGGDLPGVELDAAPVRGACRFANSWRATRGGGRLHAGVDLISPAGTPVVAVANGTLTRQTTGGARSGNAWWLTTSTGTYFFYAHLASFGNGLSVGSYVQAGDVIGYVGSTGNAVSPHLHFEIHPGGGGAVNPYSAIWMIGGCKYDRRFEQTPLS
jgi:murein DD-endopeptidase MepM/ murein hydrolase activator NlpD